MLIRPLLTYGCSIWFNISASLMEKIRTFERKCLRACVNMHRSTESAHLKFICNKKLYDTANIPRIDNYIIYLIREHYLQTSKITQNSLIYGALYPNPMYYETTLITGYTPSEGFLYLDEKGYV